AKPRIAVLGLNPHASDGGMFGTEGDHPPGDRRRAWRDHLLYNLNIPTLATADPLGNAASAHELLPFELQVATMNVSRWPAEFEERRDPKNRRYYWASGSLPDPKTDTQSDLAGIRAGRVTLTPLTIDRTRHDLLAAMQQWGLGTRDWGLGTGD
ncbi:MAG: 4-hydroxythreonine-4-phosphate dehydrogenase PdxA, partial [Planctomycetota bacterium]